MPGPLHRLPWPALLLMALLAPLRAPAAVEEVVSGLNQPVRLLAPAGDSRLFVVQRTGEVLLFDRQGTALGTFLDIAALTTTFSERGLLGLAFPPDYAQTGRFYVNYTDLQGDTRIARYRVSAGDPDRADAASGEILLTVPQPEPNHNGGHLEFGPDGMLYAALGDGGGGGDPGNNAQDLQSLLGKMLRLDVSGTTGYAVPADNPFIGQPARDEIWALGLRNPWCFSFDGMTGDLYIADVGQGDREEVDIQPAGVPGGLNYGWRLMEGTLCYAPPLNCDPGGLIPPAYEYARGGSPFRCSISGGYVYRGARIPSLQGRYFFADYCSNQIWSLDWTPGGGVGQVQEHTTDMTPPGGYGSTASFGQDGLGELYILDLSGGKVFRMVSAVSGAGDVPGHGQLEQNRPNPFNPRTAIAFTVGDDGTAVRLTVLDAAGRRVRTLVDGPLPAGRRTVVWDGTGDDGRTLAAGIYLYRLEHAGRAESRKMALLK